MGTLLGARAEGWLWPWVMIQVDSPACGKSGFSGYCTWLPLKKVVENTRSSTSFCPGKEPAKAFWFCCHVKIKEFVERGVSQQLQSALLGREDLGNVPPCPLPGMVMLCRCSEDARVPSQPFPVAAACLT